MIFYSSLLAIRGLTFNLPLALFIAVGCLLVVLAVLVYRRTLPPVPTLRRRVLAALRSVALLLILFLLFEPVLNWLDRADKRAKVVLLVDRSASMAIADQGVVRDSLARAFLRRSELQSLAATDQLRVFAFADSLRSSSLDSVAQVSPDLVGTDPAKAWQLAVASMPDEDLGAIILVSDGAQNTGAAPDRVAAVSDVPIFTVGLGDTVAQKDALIAEVIANDIAYQGSTVPVKVRVRGSAISGASSRLRVTDSRSRVLGEFDVQYKGTSFEQTFDATFSADQAGEYRISAQLDSVPGEATTDNNRRSRVIRVLDSRYNVVVLAGAPSPDVTFVLQAIGRDTTLHAVPLVERRGGFVGGRKNVEQSVADADLFIFVNYPTTASDNAAWNAVRSRIANERVSLLLLNGANVSMSRLQEIEARVPVSFQPQANLQRALLRGAATHPALTARGELPVPWTDLPPVLGSIGKVAAKSFATVVAEFSAELTPELPGGPAVVLVDANNGRSAAITVSDVFRWELGLAKQSNGQRFFSELLTRLNSWLLAPADEQHVKITTDKKVYNENETVRLQGQVYGADLAPVNDATLLVELSNGERKEKVSLVSRGNGLYEGEFSPWSVGDYAFAGSAVARQDTLGKDHGAFVVEAFNLELLESRSRFDLLRAVAQNSGGAFVTADRPDSLFAALRLSERVVENAREIALWNKPLLLWILIGFLAIEWLLRKRSGML